MLETLLMVAAAVTAAVEFSKSVLSKSALFSSWTAETQSIILQLLAFVFGVIAAVAWNVNILAELPPFAAAPQWAGVVITGLLSATGSAGVHAALALLGTRGGVVAEVQAGAPKAQAVGVNSRATYAPFM